MTPRQRVEDAQVALGILVMKPKKDPVEMETVLESVVTTGELLVRDDHGISKNKHGVSFRDRNPEAWQQLKTAFWGAVFDGLGPFVVFDKVLRPKLHDILGEDVLLPTNEVGKRVFAQRQLEVA